MSGSGVAIVGDDPEESWKKNEWIICVVLYVGKWENKYKGSKATTCKSNQGILEYNARKLMLREEHEAEEWYHLRSEQKGDQMQWCTEAHTSSPEPCAPLFPTELSETSHCNSHDGSITLWKQQTLQIRAFFWRTSLPAQRWLDCSQDSGLIQKDLSRRMASNNLKGCPDFCVHLKKEVVVTGVLPPLISYCLEPDD